MGKVVRVDLTGVESFQKASEGEHICKIAAADLSTSQGGNDMIVVQFEVIKGADKGARVFENYPLSDTALWKLKGLLQALNFKADGKVQLDLDKLIGKVCIVGVVHEEYNGKIRSKADYIKKYTAAEDSADDADDDEEEAEEKPAKKEKAKKEKAPINPPADEDEDEDDDWDEDEDEEEEEKPAPKKDKKPKKEEKPAKKDSKKSKSKDDDEDDDDWDDDDWDE